MIKNAKNINTCTMKINTSVYIFRNMILSKSRFQVLELIGCLQYPNMFRQVICAVLPCNVWYQTSAEKVT